MRTSDDASVLRPSNDRVLSHLVGTLACLEFALLVDDWRQVRRINFGVVPLLDRSDWLAYDLNIEALTGALCDVGRSELLLLRSQLVLKHLLRRPTFVPRRNVPAFDAILRLLGLRFDFNLALHEVGLLFLQGL